MKRIAGLCLAAMLVLSACGGLPDEVDEAAMEESSAASQPSTEATEAGAVTVPNVTGKHPEEAMGELEGVGLETKVTADDMNAEVTDASTVERQDPAPETEVEPGATVTIHVKADGGDESTAGDSTEVTAADVEAALGLGEDWAPKWAMPTTEVELSGDTLRVAYQETTDFEDEWVDLGQKFHNFLRAADPPIQMGTIVFTDAEGIDHNVFCGKTKCADSVMGTDI